MMAPDRHAGRRRRQGMDYAETEEVQSVHAAIQREKREPQMGREPLSFWLVSTYALTIFVGSFYFGRYAGDFSSASLDPRVMQQLTRSLASAPGEQAKAEISSSERGKKIFLANCATCHQASGTGVGGQYPPLAGSEYVTGGTRRLGMILLKGLQGPIKVKGAQYGSAVMQPWEKTLTDARIADVLTYIRSEWGNHAPPVTPEGIAALRKEFAGRSASMSEEELEAIPPDANLSGVEGDGPGKPSGAAPLQVVIKNMKFDPPALEVKKGDVIEWKNDDFIPHTVTSASFDSGAIQPEQSWQHAFSDADAVPLPYFCTFHPDMKGLVIVK